MEREVAMPLLIFALLVLPFSTPGAEATSADFFGGLLGEDGHNCTNVLLWGRNRTWEFDVSLSTFT